MVGEKFATTVPAELTIKSVDEELEFCIIKLEVLVAQLTNPYPELEFAEIKISDDELNHEAPVGVTKPALGCPTCIATEY
jgi:hypothetical protein